MPRSSVPALCPDCGKTRLLTNRSRGTAVKERDENGVISQHCKSCAKKKPEGAKKTRQQILQDRRRRLKVRCIRHHGGCCMDCGLAYDGTNGYAFDFHHREPEQKSFGIAEQSRAWELQEQELAKCDLLCVICHRARHTSPY
jgi:predicted HNH restriction endonuclease